MSIHTRIKQRRIDCGFTSQEALAKAVGVKSWQTVQQWETEGGTAPNRSRMAKVAEVLKTTPEYLLYGDEAARPGKSGGPSSVAVSGPVLQWVMGDEVQLLTLYRASTEAGKQTLLTTAEAVPKESFVGIARSDQA